MKNTSIKRNNFQFKRIFIDQAALNDRITHRVLKSFPHLNFTTVTVDENFKKFLAELSVSEGKQTLWLTHFKGQFLKPCPGTQESYRCCNYLVINESTNCPIDCTYCILQSYISNPAITIYTNTEKIVDEISELSVRNPERILRIGTGELTDSLALDPITGLSVELIPAVRSLPNVLLELKSKTMNIGHLLEMKPEKVVLSWSVNPEQIARSEEYKSAEIHQRLEAAKIAIEKGFLIGLHFDPLIYYQDWEKNYLKLIEEIGEKIDSHRVAWISIGSLRFPPPLKEVAQFRFPKTKIYSEEQITGTDGKIRYLKPVRKKMYRAIHRELKRRLPTAFIYFCMESEDIWKEVTGKDPASNLKVDWLFAEQLYQKFPELNLPKPLRKTYRSPIILPAN